MPVDTRDVAYLIRELRDEGDIRDLDQLINLLDIDSASDPWRAALIASTLLRINRIGEYYLDPRDVADFVGGAEQVLPDDTIIFDIVLLTEESYFAGSLFFRIGRDEYRKILHNARSLDDLASRLQKLLRRHRDWEEIFVVFASSEGHGAMKVTREGVEFEVKP